MVVNRYDFSGAVTYHNGQFPPAHLDYQRLLVDLNDAAASLARYDEMLRSMINGDLLLAPLRRQDAVSSSRMEGTISTIEDVYRLEAGMEGDSGDPYGQVRNDDVEVFLYSRAMRLAQNALSEGQPFCEHLIRSAHQTLLGFGSGAQRRPGSYKIAQNYIGDPVRNSVHYIPIAPEQLAGAMERLMAYAQEPSVLPLIRTALVHVEFEALHPFEDGNGRIGRMFITLMLWHLQVISKPHFFVSGYFEANKPEYIDRMRAVSEKGAWTEWICFFLRALHEQAKENLATGKEIFTLYTQMRERFRQELNSQWHDRALDYVFGNPVFRNDRFVDNAGIPASSARLISRRLVERGILRSLEPAAGRRASLLVFDPLIQLLQSR